jgi:hypothetical protein
MSTFNEGSEQGAMAPDNIPFFRLLRSAPFLSGLLGVTLLLPASYFILTLLARACFGIAGLYHSIAPSFLQSPFDLFAWHKAQFILCCLLLAILFNLPAALRIRLQRGDKGWEFGITGKGNGLNTAIALQGLLLLMALILYTLIQHVRY